MNINGIPEDASAGQIGKIGGVTNAKTTPLLRVRQDDDQADTSILSKMMAKTARDLRGETGVRPDKIAQFKADLDKPVDLSDKQIDTIVSRMVGA